VKGEIPDALPKKKKTAVSHSCLIVFSRYIEMKLRQVVKQYSALSRRPMTLVGLSEDCEALFRLSKRPGSGDGKIGTDSGQIERLWQDWQVFVVKLQHAQTCLDYRCALWTSPPLLRRIVRPPVIDGK